eukprot:12030_1
MSGGLVITSAIGEGNVDFDFNEWIHQNGLKEIKVNLIKYKMTTIDTISTQSAEFRQFMCDPVVLTTKAYLMPKLFAAIDKIAKQSIATSDIMSKSKHIIVTEEENSVLDTLQTKLKELDIFQKTVDRLTKELPQSVHRMKQEKLNQIQRANKKITALFDKLDAALKKSKEKIMNDLNEIKLDIVNEQIMDGNKKNDVLTQCAKTLNLEKQYLTTKLELCHEKLETMHNMQRKERKKQIINIGKDVNQKWNKSKNILNVDCRKIQQIIDKNNKCTVNIEFIVNVEKQKNVMKNMKHIGNIKKYENLLSMDLDIKESQDDIVYNKDDNNNNNNKLIILNWPNGMNKETLKKIFSP